MAGGNDQKQKLKLLYLMRILQEETDPEHGLTMPQILQRLSEEGITAERKSIYRDIIALRDVGVDIQKLSARPVQYVLVRSEFSLDDVMMLIDAVQSSRFITERKSNQLVKSLKGLVSARERKALDKRVHVQDRVKSLSESTFHSVDIIHEALQRKRKVQFLYFSYNTDLKRKARHEGRRYLLTPVKVVYADGNYYLAGYDDTDQKIKTYRIDRMELLQLSDERAARNAEITAYEYEDFAYKRFGMFHGDPTTVTLRVKEQLVDTVVDFFGHDLDVAKSTDAYVDVRVNVVKSPQFFGWIAGLDGGVTIQAPRTVRAEYKEWLQSLIG
ncbi:MAG TPA: WYL domain-containing protein [Eggerthellaceae bacterium]|nr:WYL domain-containing protein [Eggerthellaceae bacterium]